MLNELQLEAFNAVQKINGELYEKYKKKDDNDYKSWLMYLPTVGVSFYDHIITIQLSIPSENSLPEMPIWCSETDDRIYYEKSDKYETLYKLIKRKFLLLKDELNSVKL